MDHEPRELLLVTRAEQMLAEARTIDDLCDIRDKAQAIVLWSKKRGLTQEIIVHAAALKVQAERKLGELLRSSTLAKGAPGNQYTGKQVDWSHDATGPLRLKRLGLSKSESSRYQTLASLPARIFSRYVEECAESRHEPTTAGLLRLAKRHKVNASVVSDCTLPDRFVTDLRSLIATGCRFSTFYADPPWRYDNQATRAATSNHYPTMTVEDIAALPIAELAAENSHCHLWTTNGFLPAAFSVIEAWGFQYRSCLVWVKPTMGIGNYYRLSHEFLLFATRGHLPFGDHAQRSWIELDRCGHSSKPEEIRTIVEKVSPPAYLELFGRRIPDNPAWTVFGNQLEHAPGQ